jgi:putative tryptophan/tyrosine transport system substrate-binding protein
MANLFRYLLTIGLVVLFLIGCENKPAKPDKVKIGIVNMVQELEDMVTGFKSGLKNLGYEENKNIVYFYDGPLKREELQKAIGNLSGKKPDLVFSLTTPVTLRVQEAFEKINTPIIAAPIGDPVGSGFAKSLREPGGNISGIQSTGSEEKGLQWLLKVIPGLKRICVPIIPGDKALAISSPKLKAVASRYDIALLFLPLRSHKNIIEALDRMPEDAQAIWQMPSPFWNPYFNEFIQAQFKHGKPLRTHTDKWVEAGALLAYGSRGFALGEQAGRMAHKVIQGVSPAELPIEQAEFFLSINLKTAERIGLRIPDSVIRQADTVIR